MIVLCVIALPGLLVFKKADSAAVNREIPAQR